MNFDDSLKKAQRYCEIHREIVKLIPIIRAVIPKFDGKVYNKRLDTALKKAAEEKHGKDLFFTSSRCADGSRLFIYGHMRMNYNDSPCLCRIELNDEKRIDAKQAIKSCGERYAEILKECAEIEAGAEKMPEIIGRLDELYTLQQSLIKQIPRNLYYWYDIERVLKYGAT